MQGDYAEKKVAMYALLEGLKDVCQKIFVFFELPRIDLLQFQHYFHSFQTQRDVSKRPVSISTELQIAKGLARNLKKSLENSLKIEFPKKILKTLQNSYF